MAKKSEEGSSKANPVTKNGSKVKVDYVGTLDDGTVFDSSENTGPLSFEVGAGQVIPGFEKGVIGMKKGEEKKISIPAKDAYGERNEQMVQPVPKNMVNVGREVKEGMMLGLQAPNGQKIPVRVSKVDDDNVYLDMNHPLAGKNLNFDVTMVSIE
ncbi:peptidylprolyl isomerase [Candidatus Woesearchaeota archaeon CG10_big_fil_rev_8_21_14_0_10_44_13]|nr:MAG: peptidylprolyl isomerase [Candidatus Woesearchaeota archaeon CG10_big_fil_rev_8_21_14_0_10_44_13]